MFHNIDSKAYTIVAGYKINDTVIIEAGYGHNRNDYNNLKNKARAYYLESEIKIADGFTITPEIGKTDYQTSNGIDEGEIDYLTVKWQFNF